VNADGRLKNQLDREVPELAAQAVFELFQKKSATPDRLVAHTGGRDVILAIEDRLPAHPLDETRAVLRDHGNISSPSVLAALERSIAAHPEARQIWLTAFGAGFSAHAGELSRDK
jgi:alkylresorcinol/alkylpyrone synthase